MVHCGVAEGGSRRVVEGRGELQKIVMCRRWMKVAGVDGHGRFHRVVVWGQNTKFQLDATMEGP